MIVKYRAVEARDLFFRKAVTVSCLVSDGLFDKLMRICPSSLKHEETDSQSFS